MTTVNLAGDGVTLAADAFGPADAAGFVAAFQATTPQLEVIVATRVGYMYTGERNGAFSAELLDRLQRHLPLSR